MDWISVDDDLPDLDIPVLVKIGDNVDAAIRRFEADFGWFWESYQGFGFLNDKASYDDHNECDFEFWKYFL